VEIKSVDSHGRIILLKTRRNRLKTRSIDALAVFIMEREGIYEIYTFDRNFKKAKVTIVQE
jgi:predicted nucleic acid-binding protein